MQANGRGTYPKRELTCIVEILTALEVIYDHPSCNDFSESGMMSPERYIFIVMMIYGSLTCKFHLDFTKPRGNTTKRNERKENVFNDFYILKPHCEVLQQKPFLFFPPFLVFLTSLVKFGQLEENVKRHPFRKKFPRIFFWFWNRAGVGMTAIAAIGGTMAAVDKVMIEIR